MRASVEYRAVTALMKLVAEKGYEATSIAEICRESEIAFGTFYKRFGSKALLLQHADRLFRQQLDETVWGTGWFSDKEIENEGRRGCRALFRLFWGRMVVYAVENPKALALIDACLAIPLPCRSIRPCLSRARCSR
jgi:AcrR family transcriptional regulator